jgi:hypothetical protein
MARYRLNNRWSSRSYCRWEDTDKLFRLVFKGKPEIAGSIWKEPMASRLSAMVPYQLSAVSCHLSVFKGQPEIAGSIWKEPMASRLSDMVTYQLSTVTCHLSVFKGQSEIAGSICKQPMASRLSDMVTYQLSRISIVRRDGNEKCMRHK